MRIFSADLPRLSQTGIAMLAPSYFGGTIEKFRQAALPATTGIFLALALLPAGIIATYFKPTELGE